MFGSDYGANPASLLSIESGVFFLILLRIAFHLFETARSGIFFKNWILPSKTLFLCACSLWLGITLLFNLGLGSEFFFLSLIFAGALLLAPLSPAYAIALFISLLFLRPWEIIPENAVLLAMPRWVAIYAAAIWLFHGLLRKKIYFFLGRDFILMLLFSLWIFLSTFVSNNPEASREVFFDSFFRVFIIYFMVTHFLENSRDISLLRDCILLSALGLGLVALFQHFGSLEPSGDRLRAIGSLENSNDLAAILILALPFSFSGKSAHKILFSAIVAGLTFYAVWLSQSRGAFLAILLMVSAYMFSKIRNRGLAILAAVLICSCIIPLRLTLQRDSEDIQESTDSRIGYWKAGLKMGYYNPIMGVGFNGFPQNYERYASQIRYEYGYRTAHSTWILALAETGIPGLLALLALYCSALLQAYSIRNLHPELLFSLIGYGVVITFLSHTYLIYPYILLGLTIAAVRISRKRDYPLKQPSAPANFLVVAFLFTAIGFSPDARAADALANRRNIPLVEAAAGGNKPIGNFAPPTAKNLSLRGSRGEVLNFLLHITNTDKSCFSLSLEANQQKSPVPDLGLLPMRYFRMPKVKTAKPSYPKAYVGEQYDPLVLLDAKKICAAGWIWGELDIAKSALPGKYSAQIRINGKPALPVEIEVWPMVMPDFPTLPAYAELTTWFNLLAHFGAWHAGEGSLAKKYLREMEQHRIFPLKTFVKRPQVIEGPDKSPLLDTENPKGEDSFNAVALHNDPNAYIDFPSFDAKANPEQNKKYWMAVQNTIARFHLQGRAISYFWDEPKKSDRDSLLAQAKLAHQFAPDLKLLVTTELDPALESSFTIFAPVMNYVGLSDHPTAEKYREAKKRQKEFWWYLSCMSHGCTAAEESGLPDLVLDRPAAWIRSIAWLSERYGAQGFLYYSVNNGYQFAPKRDPWQNLWDFHGNGDGTLFYPGKPGQFAEIKEQRPIPSIRLKLWREASFDADYIHWMEAAPDKPSWWPSEYEKIAQSTRNWSKDYNDYQKLRDRIGNFLSSAYGASQTAVKK